MTRALDGLSTPDARYIVVRGRLWRATNPGLGASTRARWTRALMQARRQLRRKSGATESERNAARRNVQRAKLALGERGPVWWDDGAPDFNRRLVRKTPYAAWYIRAGGWAAGIARLLAARDASSSICPSDVARADGRADWRQHLDEVRHVARHLARRHVIAITQRSRVLDPDDPFSGPIRLRRYGWSGKQ